MNDEVPVAYSTVDGVAHIVLQRPEKSNAFDLQMAESLLLAVRESESESVQSVMILGAGPRFCAGGDVSAFAGHASPSTYLFELASLLGEVTQRLCALPKPVIVGVHGVVAGGGLGLMLSADVVLAAADTRFTAGYPGIGLSPDCGVSYLLPKAVGDRRALDFFLTGRVLSSEEALAWGMVNYVVPDAELRVETLQLADRLARGPGRALAAAKRLVRSDASSAALAVDEAHTISALMREPDAIALTKRFLK
ncbi:enoyl-CoA hydratase/isomerase family protein [Dactylosporangium sp. CA-233914]|uniref:enoyl-CoA hydratase/isomerase family protein n=1 Tax=Dactylosporangium sp. CA-233914 TaxID=3239934 RepID=UPI003D903855